MLKLLNKDELLFIHKAILTIEEGFNPESFDVGKLEGVIGRIESTLMYSTENIGAFDLAAIYAEYIARGHALPDGNKRTAFVSAITALLINLNDEIPLLPKNLNNAFINNANDLQRASFVTEFMVLVAEGKLARPEIKQTFINFFAGTKVMNDITTIDFNMLSLIDFLVNTLKNKKK